jgi:hypothetical protein
MNIFPLTSGFKKKVIKKNLLESKKKNLINNLLAKLFSNFI